MDALLPDGHHATRFDASPVELIRECIGARHHIGARLGNEDRRDRPVVVDRLVEQVTDLTGVDVGSKAAGDAGPEEGEEARAQQSAERAEGDAERTVEELTPRDTGLFGRNLDEALLGLDLDGHRNRFFGRFGLCADRKHRGFGCGLVGCDRHRGEFDPDRPIGCPGLVRQALAPVHTGPAGGDGECADGRRQSEHGDADEKKLIATHSKFTQSLRSSKKMPSRQG